MTIRPPTVFGLSWTPARNPEILRSAYNSAILTSSHLRPLPAGMTIEQVEEVPVVTDYSTSYSSGTAVALRPALADQEELDRWAEEIVPVYAEFEHK